MIASQLINRLTINGIPSLLENNIKQIICQVLDINKLESKNGIPTDKHQVIISDGFTKIKAIFAKNSAIEINKGRLKKYDVIQASDIITKVDEKHKIIIITDFIMVNDSLNDRIGNPIEYTEYTAKGYVNNLGSSFIPINSIAAANSKIVITSGKQKVNQAQSVSQPQNTSQAPSIPQPQSLPQAQGLSHPQGLPQAQSLPQSQGLLQPKGLPQPQNLPQPQGLPQAQNLPQETKQTLVQDLIYTTPMKKNILDSNQKNLSNGTTKQGNDIGTDAGAGIGHNPPVNINNQVRISPNQNMNLQQPQQQQKQGVTINLEESIPYQYDNPYHTQIRKNPYYTFLMNYTRNPLLNEDPEAEYYQRQQQQQQPNTTVQKQKSPVQRPTSPVERQTNPVKRPTSPVEKQANPVQRPTSPVKKQPNPIQRPTSPIQRPGSPVQKPTNPVQNQTTSVQIQGNPVQKPTNPIQKPLNPVQTQTPPIPKPLNPIQAQTSPVQNFYNQTQLSNPPDIRIIPSTQNTIQTQSNNPIDPLSSILNKPIIDDDDNIERIKSHMIIHQSKSIKNNMKDYHNQSSINEIIKKEGIIDLEDESLNYPNKYITPKQDKNLTQMHNQSTITLKNVNDKAKLPVTAAVNTNTTATDKNNKKAIIPAIQRNDLMETEPGNERSEYMLDEVIEITSLNMIRPQDKVKTVNNQGPLKISNNQDSSQQTKNLVQGYLNSIINPNNPPNSKDNLHPNRPESSQIPKNLVQAFMNSLTNPNTSNTINTPNSKNQPNHPTIINNNNIPSSSATPTRQKLNQSPIQPLPPSNLLTNSSTISSFPNPKKSIIIPNNTNPNLNSVIIKRSSPISHSEAKSSILSTKNTICDDYMLIKHLIPYQSFTLKARIIKKNIIREFEKYDHKGKVFSIDLLDEDQWEIQGTFFDEAVDKWYNVLKEGKAYIISEGQVEEVPNKMWSLKNRYQIKFNTKSIFKEIPNEEGSSIPLNKYTCILQYYEFLLALLLALSLFESMISRIMKSNHLLILHALLRYQLLDQYLNKNIKQNVGDAQRIQIKSGEEKSKRNVELVDDTKTTIQLGLWGEQATSFPGKPKDLIIIKNARVSEYNQVINLTGVSTTQFFINNLPQNEKRIIELQDWIKSNDIDKIQFNKLGDSDLVTYRTLSEITEQFETNNTESLTSHLTATISHIKTEGILYYLACPGCSKKISEDNGSICQYDLFHTHPLSFSRILGWRCSHCEKIFEEPNVKYTLLVNLIDASGSLWISCFDDTAEELLGNDFEVKPIVIQGVSAKDLKILKDLGHEDQILEILREPTYEEYYVKITSKSELYNSERKVRNRAIALHPVNYAQESKEILALLGKYEAFE